MAKLQDKFFNRVIEGKLELDGNDVIAKYSVDNIEALTDKQLDSLKCGDIVCKEDSSGKHSYIVSFKKDGVGICLTYADGSGYIETVSYDWNNTTKHWVYNSTDVFNADNIKGFDGDIVVTSDAYPYIKYEDRPTKEGIYRLIMNNKIVGILSVSAAGGTPFQFTGLFINYFIIGSPVWMSGNLILNDYTFTGGTKLYRHYIEVTRSDTSSPLHLIIITTDNVRIESYAGGPPKANLKIANVVSAYSENNVFFRVEKYDDNNCVFNINTVKNVTVSGTTVYSIEPLSFTFVSDTVTPL